MTSERLKKVDAYLWYSGMIHGGFILADLVLGKYSEAFWLFAAFTFLLVSVTLYLKFVP